MSYGDQVLAEGVTAVTPGAAEGVFGLLWLVIALPLVSAAVLLVGGKTTDAWGHLLGCAAPIGSFLLVSFMFLGLLGRGEEERQVGQELFTWFSAGNLEVRAELLYDPLSALFLLLITGVGSLIHVYSVGYMEHDPRRRRFFGYLNLFVAAMVTLVLAGNYVVLFLGWEGVGLASYLLIGFWQHKPSAAAAAIKAFVINRVGDIGLSLAVALMFVTVGSTSFAVVSAASEEMSEGTLTALGLLLLLAACGKSAQVPLQAWLLDAMEGPTPVSALIHAATMVTAGVYLVTRSNFIFELAPVAQTAVVVVGAVTLLWGAVIGCAKDDIKKALAGSTMSQIGYMMLAAGLGVAGYAFAIFHLLTHGFFKANMFLGAGSVMHAMTGPDGEGDVEMRHYGALRAALPVTFATFATGYLAIIGVPPFAGFWSKDKIIEVALDQSWLAGLCALLGAGVTAFYMSRLMLMTFFTGGPNGKGRWAADTHPHESPPVMTIPLVVLGALSVLGGLMLTGGWIVDFLAPVVGKEEHGEPALSPILVSTITLIVVACGVAAAWLLVGRREVPRVAPQRVSLATRAARADLYGDAINEGVVIAPGRALVAGLTTVDRVGVDGLVENGSLAVAGLGGLLRRVQTGFVRSYALTLLGGESHVTWLPLLVAVPAIGALAAGVMRIGARRIGLAFSLLTFVVAVGLGLAFDHGGGTQFEVDAPWIQPLGVHFALGLDGLGLLMVLLTAGLVPIVLVASWPDMTETREHVFVGWVLALEALSLAVFTATDVFLFYVVFEATLIPAYFLIGGFGRDGRGRAAVKFLIYQLAGGLIMLASVIGLYVQSANAGTPSYLLEDLARLSIDETTARWLFVGFFVAFAVKAPMFPVHTWLADTTAKATTGTSVLLVCVLDKIGTFGMLRFCLGLFPEASQWATPVVVILALISILYGAVVAIGQDDVLRLIGLTSLSHFGFIVLGIFVFTSHGGAGSVLYMVNHGIGTAALFLVAGFMIRRSGSPLISELRGLEKVAPRLAGFLLVAGLAGAGLPGLAPFVSEVLVLISAFDYAWWAGAVAVLAIVLAAIYMLWMYQRTMTGPTPPRARRYPDLGLRETVAVAPLLVMLVVFGFYPRPLLSVINPYVDSVLTDVGIDEPGLAPAVEDAAPEGAD
jgi:NADH-quinone oxidoreductase subunit L